MSRWFKAKRDFDMKIAPRAYKAYKKDQFGYGKDELIEKHEALGDLERTEKPSEHKVTKAGKVEKNAGSDAGNQDGDSGAA